MKKTAMGLSFAAVGVACAACSATPPASSVQESDSLPANWSFVVLANPANDGSTSLDQPAALLAIDQSGGQHRVSVGPVLGGQATQRADGVLIMGASEDTLVSGSGTVVKPRVTAHSRIPYSFTPTGGVSLGIANDGGTESSYSSPLLTMTRTTETGEAPFEGSVEAAGVCGKKVIATTTPNISSDQLSTWALTPKQDGGVAVRKIADIPETLAQNHYLSSTGILCKGTNSFQLFSSDAASKILPHPKSGNRSKCR